MNEKRRRKRRKRGKQRKDSVHSSGDESDNDSDIHMNNLSNISQRLDRMERGIESVDQAIKSMSERKKKKTKRKTKKTTRERKKTNTNEKYPRSVILNGEKWNRSHSKEEKRYFWTDSCRKASWNPWNEIAKINAPWITSKQKYSKFKDDKGKPYWYDYENDKSTYKKPKGMTQVMKYYMILMLPLVLLPATLYNILYLYKLSVCIVFCSDFVIN
eukprot:1039509_1